MRGATQASNPLLGKADVGNSRMSTPAVREPTSSTSLHMYFGGGRGGAMNT